MTQAIPTPSSPSVSHGPLARGARREERLALFVAAVLVAALTPATY